MKKTLVFIAILAFSMGQLFAGPVDAQRAQQIGNSFLRAKALKSNIQLNLAYTSATRDAVDYYVFNVPGNNGFVIIAGDDRVKPILAYSTTGSFDVNNLSDGFNFTLNGFCEEIQYVREHNIEATADIVAEWNSVSKNGVINQGRGNRAVVGPLLQSTWHQNFPYNSQCPEDPDGNVGHVYAGCVATAMGQVMKFWNWPAQGTGSYTYYPNDYPQQTANFGETEYHFELMPNDLDSLSTEDDYFYIAQLLHHCGIAVEMIYGPDGSGAFSGDVPPALRNYFGYSCDDHITNYGGGWWGPGYSNEEWIQMLKDGGLDEGLPLYYSGQDDSGAGGHAFVCDGYDENDYFHFNWGWSGKDDAWCPIGALNTTKYAFNQMNGFTGHIIPNSLEYNNRPENITDFEVVENEDMTSVTISWTNPEHNLNGQPLGDITVYVSRNGEVIYNNKGVKGDAMEFVDNNLEAGLYKYSVIVENEAGFNNRSYFDILVGDKCDITFELTDDGGDGWKGACISVTTEDGQRIGSVTMTEGSAQTVVMPLLKGNLNFIWNHGWYHTSEQYDTDYECHFIIKNANDEVLYTSGEHSDGVFMTYNNNCGTSAVDEVITSNIRIYPNPTKGILNIEGNGEMTISVLNVLGQKVLEASATANTTIDLSGFGEGIYMVRIETENRINTEKVNVIK
ncbi:MAG: C10 family peptidase [Bacteroidales bacterium]|nr:C10 family peptidase [Bacteroidales bacterium]